MNKLTIKDGNKVIDFMMHSCKFVLGSNYQEKYWIKQKINQYFHKSVSELRTEHPEFVVQMLINDKPMNTKRTMFLQISPHYSVLEDSKLSAKSLLLKYLELKLIKPKYFDTIHTINILFESFSEELNEDDFVCSSFLPMTVKQLVKLLIPSYVDDYQKDEFDLSYEELIILQIKMIKEITERNESTDHILIFAEIPKMTDLIYEHLMSCKNCLIIVITENYRPVICCDDIYITEDISMDIADEENLYYLISEKSCTVLSMEEIKMSVKKYIEKRYINCQFDLINNIIHFSK